MKEKYIHFIAIVIVVTYGGIIVFLYAAEPRSIEEATSKARTTIETIATKGTVVIGTYQVDAAKFNDGLAAFRQDRFVAARDSFELADPEMRDPRTQYYVAYSYYRQGWGRISNDDQLFRRSLEILDRLKVMDPDFRSDDADLKAASPAELRKELEEGLKVTTSDLNPLRVFRERM